MVVLPTWRIAPVWRIFNPIRQVAQKEIRIQNSGKARGCRDGAIIFSGLIGKLDMLRVECSKCGRSGRYRLVDLLMRYGRNAKVFAFTDDVTANCTRKSARSDSDPCSAIFPDLPKVI